MDDIVQNVKNSISRNIGNIREYITPVLENSNFINKGVLTPDEFVKAGDYLISISPKWKWLSGDNILVKEYLPKQKQFLLIENIPCYQRVESYSNNYKERLVEFNKDDKGWIETNLNGQNNLSRKTIKSSEKVNLDKINDNDDFLQELEEDFYDDDSICIDNNSFINVRYYNITITYDKYYQTPKLWMLGYNNSGQPLTYTEIFQDIISDYANKTVTIEKHPHLNDGHIYASIHPCQHSKVMKILINNTVMGGKMPLVEEYLIYFLKFMSSIMPYIIFDNTKELKF